MKKIATLAFAAVMAMTMTSCKSDVEKAISILEDATEELKDAKTSDEVTKITTGVLEDGKDLNIDMSKLDDKEKEAYQKASSAYSQAAGEATMRCAAGGAGF